MTKVDLVSIRLEKEKTLELPINKINSPQSAAFIFEQYLKNLDKEHFVVMCLNAKNIITNLSTVSIGTLTGSIVHPREVFKTAILSNSECIVVAHNHPSGDPTPSQEDINITERLEQAGKMLGIHIMDHIIIGNDRWYSFRANCMDDEMPKSMKIAS